MIKSQRFNKLSLLSNNKKKKHRGGSLWTGSLAFAMISSTIMNFVQLIFNIINSTNSNNIADSESTSKNHSNNYSTLTSTNSMFVRLSNSPIRTTVNYPI